VRRLKRLAPQFPCSTPSWPCSFSRGFSRKRTKLQRSPGMPTTLWCLRGGKLAKFPGRRARISAVTSAHVPQESEKGSLGKSIHFEMKKQTDWNHVHPDRAKRIAINLFLGFHILFIVCWCLPLDTPLLTLSRNLVWPYFVWAGLFQSWNTFAPTPWSANSYVEAIVVYRDGSKQIWSFPRMEQLSLSERYFKERYRKFSENLQDSKNDALWPDVARYIARANSTARNPVKTIILVQVSSIITPGAEGSYQPGPWVQHVLYGYGVKPKDFE
jgi:hypothetical protein